MFTLGQLQSEHCEWANRNFPERKNNTWFPLLGIEEEVGEVFESTTPEDIADAIGDVTIYLCDYCTLHGIDIGYHSNMWDAGQYHTVKKREYVENLQIAAGRLCHAHLKDAQGIRYTHEKAHELKLQAISLLVKNMVLLSGAIGLDYISIVETTWNKVKQRDWIKKPMDAHLDINQQQPKSMAAAVPIPVDEDEVG